ncbi:hypothetical protein [Pararhizobium sp. DWP3-4]|uniref:hypothetical protein n=1 Tax=Pararhizobium sp. DWP3-4 TaxID=2804565 RepID=UPI003CE9B533
MSIYAWTISKPGRQSTKKVGHLNEMLENLRALNPTGSTPVGFVTLNANVPDNGIYTHGEGSREEWSVSWTKIDG